MIGGEKQLLYFLLAVATGAVGGMAYEPFSFVRFSFGCKNGKSKPLAVALDIAFWVCFAGICIFAEFVFAFPSFRWYIWAGYALGGIIYLKTLHRIVAFFEKVCYNRIAERIKKAKKTEKTLKKRRLHKI